MDPFTERMVRRANIRSKWIEKLENLHTKARGTTMNRESNKLENNTDVSYQKKFDNVHSDTGSEFCYEPVPIRSPRSYKPSDAILKINKKCNLANENGAAPKEDVVVLQKKLEIEELQRPILNIAAKEVIPPPLEKATSITSLGETFIPEAISTPKISKRSMTSSLINNQEFMLFTSTSSNKDPQLLCNRINQRDCTIRENQSVGLTKNEYILQEKNDYQAKSLSSNLLQVKSKFEKKNESNGSGHDFVNFDEAINKITMENSIEIKNTDSEKEVRSKIKTANNDFGLDRIEEATKDENNGCDLTNIQKLNVLANARENTKCTIPQVCKVNLEDLDDMEDRVSHLEIKVNELKMEEIALPGIKQAHIMTEVLPLSYIKELPESSITNRNENSHVDCTKELSALEKTNMQNAEEKEKSPNLKVSEDVGDKFTILPQSSSESNIGVCRNCEETILSVNKNELLEKSSVNSQKYSTVTNESEWDTRDTSHEVNFNTLTEFSLNDQSLYSFHSSDFSNSCSCSTSVSQSSFPLEIQSESLPFLLLQNLSYRKKNKKDTGKSKWKRVDNIDIAINCDSDNEQTNTREFSQEELKVNHLHKKVSTENTIMEQASKALSLCYSSPAFLDSPEQIEGERLLLLSTIRRQAALDEIRRLEVQMPSFSQKTDHIEVGIEKIKLPLRDDFIYILSTSKQPASYYFVCLLSHQDTVLSTDIAVAKKDQTSIKFLPTNFKIEGQWCDDFWIVLRVYALRIAEVTSEKSHRKKLQGKRSEANIQKHASTKCQPRCLTSCSTTSGFNLNHSSNVASTQHIIHIPSFVLIARAEMHLPDDLHCKSFVLQQYETYCDNGNHFKLLHDTAHMKIRCAFKTTSFDIATDKSISKQYKGFLTRFNMISGSGAWQREWCCLKGTYLLSWKYPEDEECLPPHSVMDLKLCTNKILPVSRIKCARRNTFSIKMKAEGNTAERDPVQLPTEGNSILGSETEHILSADTREERDDWCNKLNSILLSLQSWSIIPNFFQCK